MFPSYLQPDSMDCGPACLRIISKFYGKNYSMLTLRDRCYMSREGVSLLDLSDAAESLGFRTTGISTTWEVFRDEVPLPCIVYWNSKHYVVVYKIRKRRGKWWVYVSDPAVGLLKYDEEKFLRGWLKTQVYDDETDESRAGKQGVILLLEPTPRFYESPGEENTQLKFSYLLQYLKPYKSYFVQLVLAMLVASGLNLILPFLTQSIVDVGIGTGNLNFVVMILIAQVALTLGQFANNLIRQWLSLHMTTRISISYISDFLCKLMRLPIAYFDAKKSGDILQRIGDYGRVQSFLTGTLLSMAVAILTFIVYTCVMAGYSATILLVFLGGSILYALWVLLFMKYRRKLDYMRFQESSENQSTMIQLIGGMQDIKLNSCERQKRWEWERIQARLFKISIKSLTLGQTQEVGALFISQTKNIIVSFLAVSAVIKGDMTLGMMMAMQYILGQLNGPLSQFISFMQATQDAKISLERLGEIYDRPDEEPDDEPRIRTIPDSAPLEFRDVVFHYEGPNSERALDGVSLTIPVRKVTAIVGASGSGKTTMLKLLLGFYRPTQGEVLLAGRPLGQYSESCWRRDCGVVMQEATIFADTIARNIGVVDEQPDMERVRRAARMANIDEWIESLPMRYDTKIGLDGHGLSTGQRQRLFIARAAYKDAKYLFLDEATNSLDAANERSIMEKLQSFFEGRTVVVVAHRLSTVMNADNIVVLDRGRIVEQGTHKELTARRGHYYNLVRNQLELGN